MPVLPEKASACVATAKHAGAQAATLVSQGAARGAQAGAVALARAAPKTASKLGSAWETLEDSARLKASKLLLRALRRAARKLENLAAAAAQAELDVSPEGFPGRAIAGAVRRLSDDVFCEHLLPEIIDNTVLRKPVEAPLDSPPPACCACPCGPLLLLRAFVRYHLHPFDKGLFATLRDPVYLALLLVACFPYYFVSQAWWFVVLLFLIDFRDTFQCVDFVVNFKVSQFFGAFIKTFVSTVQFLLCVAHDDCATSAPGVGEHFYVAPAFFGAQAFFIIVAVAATPCSIAKGGMLYRKRRLFGQKKKAGGGEHASDEDDEEEDDDEGESGEGGGGDEYYDDEHGRSGVRLRRWLCYELVCFAAVAALGVVVGVMEEREWLRQCALHWVCILYALLGAPWIALKFPMMFLLVLGVTPTGYNRAGETVAKLSGSARLRLRRTRQASAAAKVAPAPAS